MSAKTLASMERAARETLIKVAWRQWAAIGGSASVEPASSMVDPESLLLVSLLLQDDERRLWDVTAGWAEHWSRLLSVQRTRNIAATYGQHIREPLQTFASFAVLQASDARWKPVAGNVVAPGPRKHLAEAPPLTNDRALVLRLRLGLGVGLRADVLSFLLATSREYSSVRDITTALGYTEPATRRALDDLAAAGLLATSPGERPILYYAEATTWQELLRLPGSVPVWRYWMQVFRALLAIINWCSSSRNKTISEFALETLGWEILEKHIAAYTLNGKTIRLDSDRPGFVETVLDLCNWVTDHV